MEIFSQTSHKPYDRHIYRLHLCDKGKIDFDDYETAQEYWFNRNRVPDYLNYFEVLDKPKAKVKTKGFG